MLNKAMKRLFYTLLLTVVSCLSLVAQPCTQLDIQDKKQQKALKRFVRDCEAKGFLKPDSGLIHLTEWVDSENQTNWQVWAQTTWKQYPTIAPFKGHCTDCLTPVGWTKVSKRLVLLYKGNRSDTLTTDESNCLRKIVANYATVLLLALPPKEVPMVDANGRPFLDKEGKPKMRPFLWPGTAGGGGGHNTHMIFKKNGSIEKGLSL